MRCPGDTNQSNTFGKDCQSAVYNLGRKFIAADIMPEYKEEELLNMCLRACASRSAGESCSQNQPCTPGSSFCDYSLSDSGTCQECPLDVDSCYQEGFISTEMGKKECVKCSLECVSLSLSQLTANGKEIQSNAIDAITSNTVEFNRTGSLKDCSRLILDEVEVCEGAAGRVCLVEDYTFNTLFWQLTEKAERSGCVAVIMYADYSNAPENEPCRASHSYGYLGIPFVCVSYTDGKRLVKEHLHSDFMTVVSTNYLGLMCFADNHGELCSNTIPCSYNTAFCNYEKRVVNGLYVEGFCDPCNEDPIFCYFDPGSFFLPMKFD